MSFKVKTIGTKTKLKEKYEVGLCFKYKLNPNKNENLQVKEILIISPEIINILVASNFNKKYKKIIAKYIEIVQSDNEDSGDSLAILLDEVARLHTIILKKYQTLLKKKDLDKFIKKLRMLEHDIREKYTYFRLIKEMNMGYNKIEEEQKSMSR